MLCAPNEADSAKQSFLMCSECPNALLHQELRHRVKEVAKVLTQFKAGRCWKCIIESVFGGPARTFRI